MKQDFFSFFFLPINFRTENPYMPWSATTPPYKRERLELREQSEKSDKEKKKKIISSTSRRS
jgi:hypothetical protein